MGAARVSESSIVVAARDLLAAEFSREFVILNLADGVYYGLDDVAARVWTLVQSPVAIGTICEALVADYEVEPVRCRQDLEALMNELVSRGLVVVHECA